MLTSLSFGFPHLPIHPKLPILHPKAWSYPGAWGGVVGVENKDDPNRSGTSQPLECLSPWYKCSEDQTKQNIC